MDMLVKTVLSTQMSMKEFLICTAFSIVLGGILALSLCLQKSASKSLMFSMVIMPFTVEAIIMAVNGNIGTGITVVGAFSLIRFRSLPGNAKSLVYVFVAMTVGIICGGGYIGIAAVITVLAVLVDIVFSLFKVGDFSDNERVLKITIPESLDYEGIFDEVFAEYADSYKLNQAKTTNLGSLYQLTYGIKLKNKINEKEFMDTLRTKNSNLEISLSRPLPVGEEL